MLRSFLPIGYRNLRLSTQEWLQFERLNLLVGPNNSGKSNFIRAMSFPRDMLLSEGGPTKFLHAVEKHGRADVMNRTLRAGKVPHTYSAPAVVLYWILDNLSTHKHPDEKTFGLPPPESSFVIYGNSFRVGNNIDFPTGFHIGNESVFRTLSRNDWLPIDNLIKNSIFEAHTNEGGKLHIKMRSRKTMFTEQPPAKMQELSIPDFSKNESIFGQIPSFLKNKDFYEKAYPDFSWLAEQLQEFSQRFHTYTSTDLDVRKLADGAKIDLSVRVMDKEGSQFINVLRYLDQQHDFLDQYAEHLRELLPDLKRIKIVDASDTYKQVELHIGGQKYKLHEMSDGTLKALWLALLLFSPELGSVLSIDEPELNLHPAWLKVIGRWAQRFTSAEQLFLSTHSPDLLDTFTEGFKSGQVALFVFGLGDKEVRRVQPSELESFFKDGWELGDLYRVGEPALGGWPW